MADKVFNPVVDNINMVTTASSSPASGAAAPGGKYNPGDFAISNDGSAWINTVAGAPGTWKQVGANLAGATTITSASANAFDVGPTGATSPVFKVDASANLVSVNAVVLPQFSYLQSQVYAAVAAGSVALWTA